MKSIVKKGEIKFYASISQFLVFRHLLLMFLCLLLSCSKNETPEPNIDPNLVYFLVVENEPAHGDSYILPLKDPGDIAMARELIKNNEKKIVVAEISNNQSDNYSVNKDLLHNKKWSWHVTNFIEFADVTAEIYDGWPTYVEENYEEWVKNTQSQNGKGVIGFWSYSITREVDKSELY